MLAAVFIFISTFQLWNFASGLGRVLHGVLLPFTPSAGESVPELAELPE